MCYTRILVTLKDGFVIFQLNPISSFFFPFLLLTRGTCFLVSSYCLQEMRVKTALTRNCDQTQLQSHPPRMKQVPTKAILPSGVLLVTAPIQYHTSPLLHCY